MERSQDRIVEHVSRHISISAQEQQLFLSLLREKRLLRRQYLLQAGDICRHENYVLDGCLRSFYVDDKGEEHTLHFALPDWWITDLESFLNETPAEVHVVALTPVTVLQLDKSSLERLYKEIPVFERFFRILHQNAYLAQNRRILNNISLNGEARYLDILQRYPALIQSVPQKYIASYLGMTPVFLSQIRARTGNY